MKYLTQQQFTELKSKSRARGKMQNRIDIVEQMLMQAKIDNEKFILVESEDFSENELHYNIFSKMKSTFENSLDLNNCRIGNCINSEKHTYDSFILAIK